MDRLIVGFHQDDEGDWVAELACGHNQHVRHRPPFQPRPWVLSPAERTARIGAPLECPLCDRAELPVHVVLARVGPRWDETTLPPALRRAHRVGRGTWGRITVHEGCLRFSMASQPPLEVDLTEGAVQAIPPEVDHDVNPLGPVSFSIDFFRVERSQGPPPSESAAPTLDESELGGDPACWAGFLCPECGAVIEGGVHRCPDSRSGGV